MVPAPRRRRASSAPATLVTLDRAVDEPLYRQCYAALRDAILGGRLAPEARLPSTRALAAEHRVSRNTIALAFDQLRAEGYLAARHRAGTFVSATLPDDLLRVRGRRPPVAPTGPNRALPTGMPAGWPDARDDVPPRAFRTGVPALDAFPARLWARLVARQWRRPAALLGYGDARGYEPLREAIAAHVAAARGAQCDAAQVVVVNGSQQGLALAARLLLAPGESAWVEDPGYPGVRAALAASHRGAGARIIGVPVDDDGIIVSAGMAAPGGGDARAAFVSPSHQYPLGATMSVSRRLALLDWAVRRDAWVVEDDYDSEFRYASRPLPCLQGLDPAGGRRVIYVGTFSKTMYPALRLGYVIVPPALVDRFVAARAAEDRHSPTVEQAALAAFIADGHYARHVRRMRALYAERQAALLDAATEGSALGEYVEVAGSGAGMHLIGWLRHGGVNADVAVARAAREIGVDVQPVSPMAMTPGLLRRGALMLGYAGYTPAAMRAAAAKLARACARVRMRHATCGG